MFESMERWNKGCIWNITNISETRWWNDMQRDTACFRYYWRMISLKLKRTDEFRTLENFQSNTNIEDWIYLILLSKKNQITRALSVIYFYIYFAIDFVGWLVFFFYLGISPALKRFPMFLSFLVFHFHFG